MIFPPFSKQIKKYREQNNFAPGIIKPYDNIFFLSDSAVNQQKMLTFNII